MLKLSIIVPVYHAESYIRLCLESIFKQGIDDADFEIIIVNDGTKDRSMEVIADIILTYNNITIINQKSQGLPVAHNTGIDVSKGKYILMPDADNLLIEDCLKPLPEKALEIYANLVVADYLWLLNIYRKGHESPTFSFNTKTTKDFCIAIAKTCSICLKDTSCYHKMIYTSSIVT